MIARSFSRLSSVRASCVQKDAAGSHREVSQRGRVPLTRKRVKGEAPALNINRACPELIRAGTPLTLASLLISDLFD